MDETGYTEVASPDKTRAEAKRVEQGSEPYAVTLGAALSQSSHVCSNFTIFGLGFQGKTMEVTGSQLAFVHNGSAWSFC